MAKAEVEVVVKGEQVDQLKGKLVELQKGLKIQYDISGKPIDVVIDKSLNLQKQVKLLTAELRRTKEGTAEFTLLSSKLNDAKDNLERVNAKSKDLFASLSLIPGPVGDFFGKLNGVIGLMKTFSGFSLKDIKNQFKETGNDIRDVFENLGILKKTSDDLDKTNKDLAQSSKDVKGSNVEQVASSNAAAAAISNQSKEVKLATVLYNQRGEAMIKATKPIARMSAEERTLFSEQRNAIKQSGILKEKNMELAGSYEKSNAGVVQNTINTKILTGAQRAATFATNALKIALASLGIGVVIAAVSYLVEAIGEWITGAKAAAAENERLASSYDLLKRSIDDTQQAIKDQTELETLRAKKAGKTEEDLYKIVLDGVDKRIKANQDGRKKIERELELLTINTKLKEEDRIKLREDLENKYIELGRQSADLRIEREKTVLSEEVRIAEKGRSERQKINEKRLQDNKAYLDKLEQDTKAGLEKLRSLEQQNALALIDDERQRESTRLLFEKQKEEEEIKALQLKDTKVNGVVIKGEELRSRLLEQVRVKYGLITLQNKKKYDEEDLKNLKDFQRETQDIIIEGIENKREKEDAQRQEKLKRDLEDLEEDKIFIKLSEEDKEKIRQFVRKKYAAEDKQIKKDRDKEDKDERLQKLDDELKFLQIRQEAIRQGTKAYYDSQIEILNAAEKREIEALDKSLLTKEEYEQKKTAIEEKYAKLRKDVKKQETEATMMAIGETFNAIAGLTSALASAYDEEAKTSKEAFEKRKRLQLATAIMSAAGGIIQILAQPSTLPSPFDWIVKGINAAAMAVTTAVQISNIKKTKFEGGGGGAGTVRGMARGGYIDGPRHAQGGVMIEAEGGEAVMTRGAVSMFGPMLSLMNQAGGGTNFSRDMMFTANDQPQSSATGQGEPIILKTYVVSNELTSEQEKQARLKQLSTL